MASMKAKKGNPFERLVAYNLMLLGFDVNRIDDNTKGIDLIANSLKTGLFIIECKFHKSFSWNEIEKIFMKTCHTAKESFPLKSHMPIFIFKCNQQPILVMYRDIIHHKLHICTFHTFFNMKEDEKIQQIPKGFKIWKEIGKRKDNET